MCDDEAMAAFTAMYDACRTPVWAYATARAGRQIADEVVSETFAIAWRRFHDIPGSQLPWLLGVARNVLRDTFRAEARRESLAAELRSWTSSAAHPGGDVGEHVAGRLALLSALASLSDEDREALVLTAWQGLTPREAAVVADCAPTAMRVRLHRARKRLRRSLSQPDEPGHAFAALPDRVPLRMTR